ncbi:hypothetical protein ACFY41_29165 [Streptomyces syringium]|uniref:hypothetical protein n=1 Tax=Streptomyces syringium TaxID=76729 RepID=UPI0036CB31C1
MTDTEELRADEIPAPFTARDAYNGAPEIPAETHAVLRLQVTSGDHAAPPEEVREYLLRHAALADRVAEESGDGDDQARAEKMGRALLDHDRRHGLKGSPYPPDHEIWTHRGPRAYTRQEYVTWHRPTA